MSISANFPTTRPSLLLDFADTRLLDPRITFARASTATFYDQTTTALAEQNLLLQSQAIGTTGWNQFQSTPTLNSTSAPDGTTTASLITASGTGAQEYQGITCVSGSTYTISAYAKAGTCNFINLGRNDATPNNFAWFNVSTGVLGTRSASASASSITSAGNGWFRCTATFNAATGSSVTTYIGLADADAGTTVTIGNTVYIWGAQLEQRSTATAYTPTTTAAITNYIPVLQTAASGVARFDCNPSTGESLGLLIEESRTNLLTYSSDFTNAAWTKAAATITTAADVAPDGTQTAQLFIPDSTSAFHYALGGTMTVSSTYTSSCYMKYAGQQYGHVFLSQAGNNGGTFDLINGTAVITGTGNTGGMTLVGNGWYRCFVTQTSVQLTYTRIGTGAVNAASTGNGYSGIFIWGAQLEAGAFATSYIPTVASQVTRAADSASMTGTNFSSWFSQSQGSFYGEVNKTTTTNQDNRVLSLYYASLINSQDITYQVAGTMSLDNTTVSTLISTVNSVIPPLFAKVAVNITPGAMAITLNGGAVATSTSIAFAAITPSAMYIGSRQNNTGHLDGHIKRVAYYPKALTSTQLQALTAS